MLFSSPPSRRGIFAGCSPPLCGEIERRGKARQFFTPTLALPRQEGGNMRRGNLTQASVESFYPHRAELELRDFAIRIECIDGQHVRRRLFEVEGDEHTAAGHAPGGTGFQHDLTTP